MPMLQMHVLNYLKNPYNTKDLYDDVKKEDIYAKMKTNMINNVMTNNDILFDVYLQSRKLEVGKDKLFIETLIKQMPDGRDLGIDTFEKFEIYKKLNTDLNAIGHVKTKDKESVKIKPI